jgi:hypothetical protein
MNRHAGVAVFAVLAAAACSSEPVDGSGYARVVFAGTSFAGEYAFEQHGWISDVGGAAGDYVFRRTVSHTGEGRVSTSVDLLVPNGIWYGPGTYACGNETGVDAGSLTYCTVRVVHGTNADYVTWSTRVLPEGAAQGCAITIAEVTAAFIRGSVSCAGLPVSWVEGKPADGSTTLSLDGTFELPATAP